MLKRSVSGAALLDFQGPAVFLAKRGISVSLYLNKAKKD